MKDFEISIIKFLRSLSSSSLDMIFRCLTFLGEQYVLIVLLAAVYFLFNKKEAQRIAFALISTLCLNNAIKGIIKYERPFTYSNDYSPSELAIEGATGYSLPSGHTQNATTLYSSLALTFKKKWITISCISIIIIVAFSRIYLGVHYPKDVVLGAVLGIVCSFGSYYLFKKIGDDFKKQVFSYLSLLIIFTPFLFILWTNDYNNLMLVRDFYISYSFSLGYILAVIIEKKFVDFERSSNLKTNILRFIGAIIILLIVYIGLKLLFNTSFFPQEGNVLKLLFDCIRYLLVPFCSLGLYPILFKNKLFKKD